MDGLAIAASLSELRPAVEGGLVKTAYQPSRDVLVLHVAGSQSTRILIAPKDASIHLTRLDIPNPQRPSTFAMLLRKHLRGGRIVSVRQSGRDRIVTFEVERIHGSRAVTVELVAELVGLRGNVLLVHEGAVVGAMRRNPRNAPGGVYEPLEPQAKRDPTDLRPEEVAAWLAEGDPVRALARVVDGVGRDTAEDVLRAAEGREAGSFPERVCAGFAELAELVESPDPHVGPEDVRAAFYPLPPPAERTETFAEALDRVRASEGEPSGELASERGTRARLVRALAKHERTAEKLRDWLKTSESAERIRRQADLLLIRKSDLSTKTDEVTLEDAWGEGRVTIPLDPSQTPVENAQRLHRRAKRLARGRPRVEARLARIEEEIASVRETIGALDAGRTLPEPVEGLIPTEDGPAARPPTVGRRWTIGGHLVLVGRNAKENDRLLRDASPDDVWMHARGVAGSHVIVRRGGRKEIPESVLREAARLAARYSKGKGSGRVEVSMAAAKHVRKPKGAPPGLVIVENEVTLTVEPDLRGQG